MATEDRSDVAAWAAYLRSCGDTARAGQSGEVALDRRLLQRVAAALAAYGTGRAILALEHVAESERSGPPLERLACPACGAGAFELITGLGALHVRCQGCDACWRVQGNTLHRVAIESCLGCDRAPLCLAASPLDGRTRQVPGTPTTLKGYPLGDAFGSVKTSRSPSRAARMSSRLNSPSSADSSHNAKALPT